MPSLNAEAMTALVCNTFTMYVYCSFSQMPISSIILAPKQNRDIHVVLESL